MKHIKLFEDFAYGKWNLDFIHKYMKKDNIDCEIKSFDEQIKEGKFFGTSGEESPSWEKIIKGEKVLIELKDVMKYLGDNNIPIKMINVKDVFHFCAHKDKTDKKTLDRSERSNLEYPIIITMKNGKYTMVLDGHHRLLKAKNNKIDKIKARIIELSKAPFGFQEMFQ